jgi:putative transposase
MNTCSRKPYPSDLSDGEWAILEPVLLAFEDRVRPGPQREVDLREVVNTIRYLNRSGCQWAMLPHDLLPKSTVYDYFAKWRDQGALATINDVLRAKVREQTPKDREGTSGEMREPTPSAACVDSQSVKSTELGGERGYDTAKKIKGRKRHILVDTLGLLLAVAVTAAHVDDGAAAPKVVGKVQPKDYPRLEAIFGDNKYHNYDYYAWLKEHSAGKWHMVISSLPPGTKEFKPLPIRWVVERTFAWIGRYRRNSKDYERRTDSSEGMVLLSSISLMLRRLSPPAQKAPAFHYPRPEKKGLQEQG